MQSPDNKIVLNKTVLLNQIEFSDQVKKVREYTAVKLNVTN